MGCLTSTQIATIRAEIATLDAQITAAETAYTSALTNGEVEEYRFDSGDGSQKAIRRSPKELRVEIEALKGSRARLQRQLSGTSNVNMNLRRRRGGHRYAGFY